MATADAEKRFDAAYLTVRVYEGGNDDDPADRGGRTSRGITAREYDAYRLRKGLAKRDVWLADEAEIRDIYFSQYWLAVHGPDMPAGIDLFLYDSAVLCGPGMAGKWLQGGLGDVGLYSAPIDGGIGVVTMRGVDAAPDHDKLVADMSERRHAYLEAIIARDHSQARFEGGWLARLANVTKRAEAAATGSIGPDPIALPESPKAVPKIPDAPVAPETGAAIAAGGAIVAGGNEALDKAGDQATTIVALSGFLRWVLLAIVLIGAGFALWSIFRNKHKAQISSGQDKLPVDRKADENFTPRTLDDMAKSIATPVAEFVPAAAPAS